jgi:hypothetical protein
MSGLKATAPMRTACGVAAALSVVGAVLCVGVAIHEWNYHDDHPYATGVSGILAVLGFGAALGCAAVAVLGWAIARHPIGGETPPD